MNYYYGSQGILVRNTPVDLGLFADAHENAA